MLAACEEAVEAGARAADRRLELLETLRDIDRQQAEREQELASEREALEAWQLEWRAATAKLGFAGELSPDEVVTRLDSLSGLFDGLVQLSDQRRRATRIEEDRAKFQEHVSEWIQTYAPDLALRAPDVAAEELVRRFQAAEHQRAESAQIQADLTEVARALSALEARTEQAESELEGLRAAARAPDLASLPGIEASVVEARGLQRQLDAVEGSLLKDEGVPLEALLAAARGVDSRRAASPPPRTRRRARTARRRASKPERPSSRSGARLRALRGDGRRRLRPRPERASGRDSRASAALRAAQAVFARAPARGRTLPRTESSPVLKRASALFPRLTLGSFRGLRVGVEERQIVAVREDGKEVSVAGLSEGTRYQLYLALRIASLERYLERNPALPLVLDDVLIHFDDERAAAALQVLGVLSERIQILFFTHHARDLALAASAIPGAQPVPPRLVGPAPEERLSETGVSRSRLQSERPESPPRARPAPRSSAASAGCPRSCRGHRPGRTSAAGRRNSRPPGSAPAHCPGAMPREGHAFFQAHEARVEAGHRWATLEVQQRDPGQGARLPLCFVRGALEDGAQRLRAQIEEPRQLAEQWREALLALCDRSQETRSPWARSDGSCSGGAPSSVNSCASSARSASSFACSAANSGSSEAV